MRNIEAFCADAGVTSCCDVTWGEGLRVLETIAIAINDHITPPPGKLLQILYSKGLMRGYLCKSGTQFSFLKSTV